VPGAHEPEEAEADQQACGSPLQDSERHDQSDHACRRNSTAYRQRMTHCEWCQRAPHRGSTLPLESQCDSEEPTHRRVDAVAGTKCQERE
jgi:hypothetical protein